MPNVQRVKKARKLAAKPTTKSKAPAAKKPAPKAKPQPEEPATFKPTVSQPLTYRTHRRKVVGVLFYGLEVYSADDKGVWYLSKDIVKGRAPKLKTQPVTPKNNKFWVAQILQTLCDDGAPALAPLLAYRKEVNK